MSVWAQFHSRLLPRVMGCPVPLANAELRNSAREFFERTRAWRQWLDPFTTYPGVRSYDIDMPLHSFVVRIEQATLNGHPLAVEGAFDQPSDPELHTQQLAGLSSADRRAIVLSQDFADGAVIQIRASLAPNDNATGVADHLFDQYVDVIVRGALARIREIPGQAFTDPERAVVDRTIFMNEVDRIKALVFRTHTSTTPRRRPIWC